MVEIQTMFVKMHKGTVYNDKFLDTVGLDGFLRIPMSVESFTVPEELSTALSKTVNEFKGVPGPDQPPRKSTENLIVELKKNSEILNQFVDKDTIVAKAMEQLTAVRDGEPLTPSTSTKKKAKQKQKKKNQPEEEEKQTQISTSDTQNVRSVKDLNKEATE